MFSTLNEAKTGEGLECKPVKEFTAAFSSAATTLWFAAQISLTELCVGRVCVCVCMFCREYVEKTEVLLKQS